LPRLQQCFLIAGPVLLGHFAYLMLLLTDINSVDHRRKVARMFKTEVISVCLSSQSTFDYVSSVIYCGPASLHRRGQRSSIERQLILSFRIQKYHIYLVRGLFKQQAFLQDVRQVSHH
jgi:hypothetical protein